MTLGQALWSKDLSDIIDTGYLYRDRGRGSGVVRVTYTKSRNKRHGLGAGTVAQGSQIPIKSESGL
ncbi:hypothetical protein E2C01_068697 [Portunus trituberculatus]|uniref:Uncharacterized protein n=1 Tax=Portunus trituberculatus TaxID=210409 RepID=A0A5B7HX50_PORTR|nr:hypothetical protein [Portunus trituberculatus]